MRITLRRVISPLQAAHISDAKNSGKPKPDTSIRGDMIKLGAWLFPELTLVPQREFAEMSLFVEDYCSHIPESIQTRIGANHERGRRKVLDDTLIDLRDHIRRFTRCVIMF